MSPVMAIVQHDFGLSATEIGVLSGLPVILFAAAAIPGSLMIKQIGFIRVLTFGLVLAAVGSALRGLATSALPLYGATILMSAGIAMTQPTLPAAVRHLTPNQIGIGTAVYTNGMIVGEIIPVASMLSIVMPFVHNDWQVGLALWSIPTLLIALLTFFLTPILPGADNTGAPSGWPNWKDPLLWRMALILGAVNTLYFCSNGFLASYLYSIGRSDLTGPALTALNLGQLPASILLVFLAKTFERRVAPFVTFGVLAILSIVGILIAESYWAVFWSGLLGFACGGALALALALAPLLSEPRHVASVSAGMFSISYTFAMLVSVLAGLVWDLTQLPSASFLIIAMSALPLIALTPMLPFYRQATASDGSTHQIRPLA